MTAMLNTAGSPPGNVSAPNASTRSVGSAGSPAAPLKCRSTRSRLNRSMPAGTGVCVVNTVPARHSSWASSKLSPYPAYSLIRSTPRNPACPSLVWNTSGSACPVSLQNARNARTPPIPSSSSWRNRWSPPPPYSRSVTSRRAGSLSST